MGSTLSTVRTAFATISLSSFEYFDTTLDARLVARRDLDGLPAPGAGDGVLLKQLQSLSRGLGEPSDYQDGVHAALQQVVGLLEQRPREHHRRCGAIAHLRVCGLGHLDEDLAGRVEDRHLLEHRRAVVGDVDDAVVGDEHLVHPAGSERGADYLGDQRHGDDVVVYGLPAHRHRLVLSQDHGRFYFPRHLRQRVRDRQTGYRLSLGEMHAYLEFSGPRTDFRPRAIPNLLSHPRRAQF